MWLKNIEKDVEKCGEVRFETKLVDLIVEKQSNQRSCFRK